MSDSISVKKVYTLAGRCPEGTGKLAEALAKAIPNIAPLVRNRVSHFAKKDKKGNPIPDYADLAQCHKAAAKALAEQGLVVIQTVTNNTDGDLVLCTQLLHSSGQYIESNIPIKASQQNPQQVASAITYARRTAYCAIVGMAADDDDDGQEASDTAAHEEAANSARIELMAIQRIRSSTSSAERDEIMDRVKVHRASGTLSAEAVTRIEQELRGWKAPAAKQAVEKKKEPAHA